MNLQVEHDNLGAALIPSMESLFSEHNVGLLSSVSNTQKTNFHSDAAKKLSLQGYQYIANGKPEVAIEAFRKLVRLEPSSNTYFLLGAAYHLSGDDQKAAINMEKVIKRDPKNFQLHRILGLIYIRLGKMTKALAVIRNAIKLRPQEAGIYLYFGYIQNNLHHWQLAIEAYEKAVSLNKKESLAYLLLSQVYINIGSIDISKQESFFNKAIENLTKYLEFDPNNLGAQIVLGELYHSLGRLEEADKVLENTLKVAPDNEDALKILRMVKEDLLEKRLFELGFLKKIHKPITDFTPYKNRKPIKIKGKPLSETVIEERR
jgi:tetratricopeptide (TPR) repeat protein